MVIIERAKIEDVEAIRRVLSETWVATYGGHFSRSAIEHVTTHWHDPSLLRSQIERAGDYFAVAKDEGTVIGLVTLIASDTRELYLPRLYVHPAYQGKGIGTRLLNTAIASYPGAAVIRLAVEQHNARGHAFWRSKGFVDTDRTTERLGDDHVAVINMERRLR